MSKPSPAETLGRTMLGDERYESMTEEAEALRRNDRRIRRAGFVLAYVLVTCAIIIAVVGTYAAVRGLL